MDEIVKARELNIVKTSLQKIEECGHATLSAALVTLMKKDFPEMTVMCINALFEWTILLSRWNSEGSRSLPAKTEVIPNSSKEESPDAPRCVVSCPANKHGWDPLLCHLGVSDIHESSPEDADFCEMLKDVPPADAVGSSMSIAPRLAGFDPGEEIYFELYHVDGDDFDFCE